MQNALKSIIWYLQVSAYFYELNGIGILEFPSNANKLNIKITDIQPDTEKGKRKEKTSFFPMISY